MLMLLPAGVQVTGPLTFRFLPSTMTCGGGGAAAGGFDDAPVFDLLSEQPAQLAITMHTPVTPTTIPRFTATPLPSLPGTLHSPGIWYAHLPGECSDSATGLPST
jgi:hypothetical protein